MKRGQDRGLVLRSQVAQAAGERRRAVHQAVSIVPGTRGWLSEWCHVTGLGGGPLFLSSHLGPCCWVLSLFGAVRPGVPLGVLVPARTASHGQAWAAGSGRWHCGIWVFIFLLTVLRVH